MVEGGAGDDDQATVATAAACTLVEGVHGFPPDAFVTTAGIARIDSQTAMWKARFMLWNYAEGRHKVPNIRTPAGNLRSAYTPNGCFGRILKFFRRETDPTRPWPRSAAVSVAQTAAARLFELHGEGTAVRAVFAILAMRAEAQTPTEEEVIGGPRQKA